MESIFPPFFSLLRAGLWESDIDDLSHFPLSDAVWKKLFDIAVMQTVEGVVFAGILKLPPALLPPKPLMLQWTLRIELIERRNKWMNNRISEQVTFFTQQGVTPYLLKGQGLAKCYPNPYLRSCGDVDWYIDRRVDYKKIIHLFEQRGQKTTYSAGFSANTVWAGCDVELHQRMLDIHNPFITRYIKNLQQEQESNSLKITHNAVHWRLPSPILTQIQVNAHILKHLLSYGIGLRQLCDSARVCYTYADQIEGAKLSGIYKKLGILRWIHVLHAALVDFLGLPLDKLPFARKQVKSRWLIDKVLQSGNFGFYDDRYDMQREHTDGERDKRGQRLLHNLWTHLPYAPMEAISFPFVQYYSRFVR